MALADSTSGAEPFTVNFDGSQSSDPEGNTLTYHWDFGDANLDSTEIFPSNLYVGPGDYLVTLTVSDGSSTAQDTVLITVTSGPAVTPVSIDIKPWHSSNRIFPWFGLISVAIFGLADLEIDDIDTTTLEFGPAGGAALRWVLRGFNIILVDDNFDDLIVFFRASRSGIQCGDSEATLTGSTFSGDSFSGTDSITTVGCRKWH